MKRILISALFAAAGLLSNAALAQGYVGASVGQSKLDIDCEGTLTCDEKDTGYKVFGGYMFTPNFGAEAAWYNHGKFRLTASDVTLGDVAAELKGNGFGLFGVAAMPFGRFSVFGKLGAVSYKLKAQVSTSVGSASESERNTSAAWGIGGGYEFTKNLGLRVEFERVRAEFMGEKDDVDLLSIGVLYRF